MKRLFTFNLSTPLLMILWVVLTIPMTAKAESYTVNAAGAIAGERLGRMVTTPENTVSTKTKWSGIESKSTGRIAITKAPGATFTQVTSGDMDPKRLTYLAPDDFYPYQGQALFTNQGAVGIYAHYTRDLLKRFAGNRLTGINAVVSDMAKQTVVKILDSNGDVIFEQEPEYSSSAIGWGMAIHVDTDILLTESDIYVGFEQMLLDGETSLVALLQSGRSETNSLLIDPCNGEGELLTLSDAFGGIAPIWCDTEGEAGLYTSDISVESVGGGRVKSGDQYNITGVFVNMGSDPVRYVTVGYQTADGTTNETILDAGEYLPYMNKMQFNMPAKADAGAGIFDRQVTVTAVNHKADDCPDDNSGTSILFSVEESMERNIAFEEYTGSWCGWCTRGKGADALLEEMYGDRVVKMQLHCTDYMEYEYGEMYNKYCDQIPGWPQAWVNRTLMSDPWFGVEPFASNPFGMGDEIDFILTQPVEAALDLDLSTTDDKCLIKATSKATFSFDVEDLAKYYSIGYLLLENNLTDVQTNYYSQEYINHPCSKEELPDAMKKFFDMPYYYVETYDKVVRAEFGALGIPNSLSGAIKSGDCVTHEIEIPTDAIIEDPENAAVAAFIIDNLTGEILNIAYKELKSTGISAISSENGNGMKEYYNLQGHKLNKKNLPSNEVIIVNDNGKIYKTILR